MKKAIILISLLLLLTGCDMYGKTICIENSDLEVEQVNDTWKVPAGKIQIRVGDCLEEVNNNETEDETASLEDSDYW